MGPDIRTDDEFLVPKLQTYTECSVSQDYACPTQNVEGFICGKQEHSSTKDSSGSLLTRNQSSPVFSSASVLGAAEINSLLIR